MISDNNGCEGRDGQAPTCSDLPDQTEENSVESTGEGAEHDRHDWYELESDGYCANCPLAYLSQYDNSRLGLLIKSADHLSFCLSQGVTVTMDDLSILEYRALRVLAEEREKAREEQQEEQQARQMAEQSRALSRGAGHGHGLPRGAGISRAKPISHIDSA